MPEKEIEKNYTHTKEELSSFFDGLSRSVKSGKVTVGQEQVSLPEKMDVEYGFKIENGQSEIEIEIKWKGDGK